MSLAISEDSNEIALVLKEEGNKAFKEEKYKLAYDFYSKAIEEQQKLTDKGTIAILLCNRAAVHLKTQNYAQCVTDCEMAITIAPRLMKAYYRRAQAYSALGDSKKAYADLHLLLRMDSKKADVIELMRTVKAGIQQ